jgi:hypothetical protein
VRPCTLSTITSRGLCPNQGFLPSIFRTLSIFCGSNWHVRKCGQVVCPLFVVNWLPLKSIAVGKRGNVLSRSRGQSRKPAVAQDAGVTRYFDQNVFKTKPETERSVSFICPGNRPRASCRYRQGRQAGRSSCRSKEQ